MANILLRDNPLNVQHWRRYIEREIGFVLPDVQLQWLMNAVAHTAAAHKLTVFQLWMMLPTNSELRQQLFDAVIIPETRFFRHIPSIDFITEFALQRYKQAENTESCDDKCFRIWSVGCASGQEVWTLAMSLASEQLKNFKILGTDVSEKALEKARLGQYDKRQLYTIPQHFQKFTQPKESNNDSSEIVSSSKGRGSEGIGVDRNSPSDWQVATLLRSHVNFVWHNIFTQEIPTSHLQQVIICQNMLLYFRKFDQRDILKRLSAQCAIGGYLVLAPGEALFWRPSNMRRIVHSQINVWQKISA